MEVKEKINNFYYWATALSVIKVMLNTSTLITLSSAVDNVLNIIISSFFILKLFSQKYTKKKLLLICIIGIFILYVSLKCGEFTFALSYLAIISMKNINLRKVLKIMLSIQVAMILIHAIIYFLNGANSEIYNAKGQIKHSLYLGHPNNVAGILMWITLEYIYLKYDKVKFHTYLVLIIINICIYKLTRSRTTLIVFYVFIVMLFFEKNFKIKKLFINLSRILMPITAIVMISLSIFYYKIPYIDKIDNILSRRVSLGNIAINKYGITMLPQKLNYKTMVKFENQYEMELIIDSVYLRYCVSYGVIFLMIMILAFYKKNNFITNKEALFLIIFIITGITENYILNAYICFVLLFLGKMLFEEKEGEKKKDERTYNSYYTNI